MILEDRPFSSAYIDNFTIFGNSLDKHLDHPDVFFTLSLKKTFPFYASIVNGYWPCTTKKRPEALRDLAFPETAMGLKQYMEPMRVLWKQRAYLAQPKSTL